MEEVAKRKQYNGGKVKVLRLQELMGEVMRQIERLSFNTHETEEAVET
jgi:hypothetical protein